MAIITVTKKKIKEIPFNRIAPNLVTLAAMSFGISSINYSIQERWDIAVISIFIAAILDGLDGRVARMLNGTTKFGAELDSLSDFVSFGVAPGFFLYLWSMQDVKGLGWFLALFFALCGAIRLARFNTMLDDDEPLPYWQNFFTGLPAPGGAMTVLVPFLFYQYGFVSFQNPAVVGTFLAVCGFLMVSTIPTISIKKLKIEVKYILPIMAVTALIAGILITEPWLCAAIIGSIYLITIPFGIVIFNKEKKKYEKK